MQDLFEQALQLVGAVDLGQEVAQLVAGLQQCAQRRHLLGDACRLEVLDRVELEIDRHLAAVVRERVVDPEVQAGGHAGHDVVEVVAVDLDELAIRQRPQRLRRIAGEVAHDADDERQLAQDLGAFGLDLVGDVDPRLADALELVVDAGTHGLDFPIPMVGYGPPAPSAHPRTTAGFTKIRQAR